MHDALADLWSQLFQFDDYGELIVPPRPKISIAGRVICMSGDGTPTSTTRPAKSRA